LARVAFGADEILFLAWPLRPRGKPVVAPDDPDRHGPIAAVRPCAVFRVTRPPQSLDELAIGAKTAQEIGWAR
jgi:hypothetical protein